jgi:hypothetical protein
MSAESPSLHSADRFAEASATLYGTTSIAWGCPFGALTIFVKLDNSVRLHCPLKTDAEALYEFIQRP